MSQQNFSSGTSRDEDQPTPESAPAAQAQVPSNDLDSLLDEIDTVLESNAEEFVRGFVQKGGQ